jgi:hypothetical protein
VTGSVTAASTVGGVITGSSASVTGTVTGSQFNGSGAGLSSIPGGNVTGTVPNATTAGGFTPSAASGTANRIVVADTNGYIFNNFINTTDNSQGSGVTAVMVKAGDNYLRSGTAAAVATFISGQTMNISGSATSSNTASYITNAATGIFATGNGTAYSQVVCVREAGLGGAAYSPPRLGWHWGGVVASSIAIEASGRIAIQNNPGTSYEALVCAQLTTSGITNSNGNGVGNIGAVGGYFNTVFAKATSAQYADLAERYVADADYAPGTVLIFGGEQEVTADISSHSTAIAGVVSENPSYLMNAELQGKHVVSVALLGRVPCQVQGTIRKGDLLVASATPGVAQKLDMAQYLPGCVIGKALANYDSDSVGTIEIAVGIK